MTATTSATTTSLTSSTSPPPTTTPFAAPSRDPSLPQSRLSYYWDTRAPNAQQLAYASHFFASKPPEFLFSASHFRTFPVSSSPEVAFLGRSNVGKSSLLNALLNRTTNKLAHVSSKPGRTKTMNVYGIGGEGGGFKRPSKARSGNYGKAGQGEEGHRWIGRGGVVIVDMPGYGKGSREEWGAEILKYLCNRKQLRRAFLLIDAAHGVKAADAQLLRLLRENAVPHQVILSKVDKMLFPTTRHPSSERMESNLMKLRAVCEEVREQVQPRGYRGPVALGDILTCSAEKSIERGKRLGMDGVKWAVLQAAGLDCDENGNKRTVEAELYQDPPVDTISSSVP